LPAGPRRPLEHSDFKKKFDNSIHYVTSPSQCIPSPCSGQGQGQRQRQHSG
jgi:hypothetical protein